MSEQQEQIRFSQEELKKMRDSQNQSIQIINQLGQIELQIKATEETLDQLNNNKQELLQNHKKLNEEVDHFVQSLNKKYGDGSLDIESGVFTPTSQKKSQKK